MLQRRIKKEITCKLTEMKTCLRAAVCASKVNMLKPDKENIRKEDDST